MNKSTYPTRFHQGFGSHTDVTFVSESLARQIKDWAVPEGEPGSGHNYIRFAVERRTMVAAPQKARKWATNKLDPDRLKAVILASEDGEDLILIGISAEAAAQKLMPVTRQCSSSLHKGRLETHTDGWRKLSFSNQGKISRTDSNSTYREGTWLKADEYQQTRRNPQIKQTKQMNRDVQPGGGGTLWTTVQDRPEKSLGTHPSNNRANGAKSCRKNHGLSIPAAPSNGGYTSEKLRKGHQCWWKQKLMQQLI